MLILALDFGAKMGYAVGDEHGKLVAHGCKNHKAKTIAESFASYQDWITKEIRQRKVDVIGYELVMAHLGTHAAHVYGGYWGITLAACKLHDIDQVYSEHVATIKKFATGNGRAEKEDVIRCMCGRFELPFIVDDNAADALALYSLITEKIKNGHTAVQEAVPKWSNVGNKGLQLPEVQRNRRSMARKRNAGTQPSGKRRRKHTSDT